MFGGTKSRFLKNNQRTRSTGQLTVGETTLAKKIVGSSIACAKVKHIMLVTI
jgi:hypothetical protein